MARLGELLARQGAGAGGPADLRLDGLLMPGAATLPLVEQIEAAGPFGAAAPAPRFAFADQAVSGPAGRRDAPAADLQRRRRRAGWRRSPSAPSTARLAPRWRPPGAARFHLAGRLEINTWGGRTQGATAPGRRRPRLTRAGQRARFPLAQPRAPRLDTAPHQAWPVRLSVRTPGFQPGKRGSTPLRAATFQCIFLCAERLMPVSGHRMVRHPCFRIHSAFAIRTCGSASLVQRPEVCAGRHPQASLFDLHLDDVGLGQGTVHRGGQV